MNIPKSNIELDKNVEKETHRQTWDKLIAWNLIYPFQRDEIVDIQTKLRKDLEEEKVQTRITYQNNPEKLKKELDKLESKKIPWFVKLCKDKWRFTEEQYLLTIEAISKAQIWDFLVLKWAITDNEKIQVLEKQKEYNQTNPWNRKLFCEVLLDEKIKIKINNKDINNFSLNSDEEKTRNESELIKLFAEFSWVKIVSNLNSAIINKWTNKDFNKNISNYLFDKSLINTLKDKNWKELWIDYWKSKKAIPLYYDKFTNNFWKEIKELVILTCNFDEKEEFINQLESDLNCDISYNLCEKSLYDTLSKNRSISWIDNIFSPEKLIQNTILKAFLKNSSDIHIEIKNNTLNVRSRTLWTLNSIEKLELTDIQINQLINMLSNYWNTDIHSKSKNNMSDEWSFQIEIWWHALEIRYSTTSIKDWFNITQRINKKEHLNKNIFDYNISQKNLKNILNLTKKTSWIWVFSGPTWSWKTTLLMSILNVLDIEWNKIITLQDPVETWEWKNIINIEIKKDNWKTITQYSVEILRLDPDVIMIWEIRDRETWDVVLKLWWSWHLTFTTIHTDDALWILFKLKNELNIDISSLSWSTLFNQRFVKKLCSCAESKSVLPEDEDLSKYNLYKKTIEEVNMFSWLNLRKAKWCHRCSEWYISQQIVMESFVVDNTIIKMINDWVPKSKIQKYINNTQKNNSLYEDWLRLMMLWIIDYTELAKLTVDENTEIKHIHNIINDSYAWNSLNNISSITAAYKQDIIEILEVIEFDNKIKNNIKNRILDNIRSNQFSKAKDYFEKIDTKTPDDTLNNYMLEIKKHLKEIFITEMINWEFNIDNREISIKDGEFIRKNEVELHFNKIKNSIITKLTEDIIKKLKLISLHKTWANLRKSVIQNLNTWNFNEAKSLINDIYNSYKSEIIKDSLANNYMTEIIKNINELIIENEKIFTDEENITNEQEQQKTD